MGILGTKKAQETSVQDCVKMIEDFFKSVDFNPARQRLPNRDKLGWWIQRGSAIVYIVLKPQDKGATLRVFSPILYLPENNILPFYRRCLELNAELINCAFGVIDDGIILVSERPIDGLNPQELEGMIGYLALVADEVDDKLAREFNAQMYNGPTSVTGRR